MVNDDYEFLYAGYWWQNHCAGDVVLYCLYPNDDDYTVDDLRWAVVERTKSAECFTFNVGSKSVSIPLPTAKTDFAFFHDELKAREFLKDSLSSNDRSA